MFAGILSLASQQPNKGLRCHASPWHRSLLAQTSLSNQMEDVNPRWLIPLWLIRLDSGGAWAWNLLDARTIEDPGD